MPKRRNVDCAEIVKLYQDGMNAGGIARRLKMSRNTVALRLIEAGIQPRVGRPRLSVDTDEIVSLHQDGMSEFAIARHFGISRDTVMRRLVQAGVQRRSVGEALRLVWAQGRWVQGHPPRRRIPWTPERKERAKMYPPKRTPKSMERQARTAAKIWRAKPGAGERRFEQALNRIGLRRDKDYIFQAPLGRFVVDFLFPDKGLAIEIDNPGHANMRKDTYKYTKEHDRDAFLAARGFETIRIPNDKAGRSSTPGHLQGEVRGKALDVIRRIAGDDTLCSMDVFGEWPPKR